MGQGGIREVLIFGTGAVGGVLGWRLSQNPRVRVSVICRSNYEAVKTTGVRVKSSLWGAGGFTPRFVCQSPHDLPSKVFDFVVCANKANSPGIYQDLTPVVSEKTAIVSAQNGIGVETPLRKRFPRNPILSGIVYAACKQPADGYFEQTTAIGPHAMSVGIVRPSNERARNAVETAQLHDFTTLSPAIRRSTDLLNERWRKQLWNGVFNTLSALTGLDTGELLKDPSLFDILIKLMIETYHVAIADGATLDFRTVGELLTWTGSNGAIVPSMLQDVRAGKPIEADCLCGNVIDLAKEYDVAVPTLAAVNSKLHELSSGRRIRLSDLVVDLQSALVQSRSFVGPHHAVDADVQRAAAEPAQLSG